jgi:2-oxo-4-hydroxy-4-carboxy-5-ureidoimidazoline decarboxylase
VTTEALDALPPAEARAALERCCGAPAWIARMLESRPFGDRAALHAAADRAWGALRRDQWLEAFAHHPRIGDAVALRQRFGTAPEWSSAEQAGAVAAPEATLDALAHGNRAYEERFGYVFIVCATGKSADEMLTLLRARLANDPAHEILIAAEEHRKIMHLRLDRLIDDGGNGEGR